MNATLSRDTNLTCSETILAKKRIPDYGSIWPKHVVIEFWDVH
jgi:hypothetical protein